MTMTKPTSEQVTFTAAGSGATLRNLVDKVREVVSVKDFGAVGNGVADDTAAIQAAIDECFAVPGAGPDALYFPAGTYKVMSPIVWNKPIRLIGANRLGSTIVAGASMTAVIQGPQVTGDSNLTSRSFINGINISGASLASFGISALTNHTIFSDFRVTGTTQAAMRIGYGWCNAFLELELSSNSGDGLRLFNNANQAFVSHCKMFLNSGIGLSVEDSVAVRISNSLFETCRKCGIYFAYSVHAFAIDTCYFEENSQDGITYSVPTTNTVKADIIVNGSAVQSQPARAFPCDGSIVNNYTRTTHVQSFVFGPGLRNSIVAHNMATLNVVPAVRWYGNNSLVSNALSYGVPDNVIIGPNTQLSDDIDIDPAANAAYGISPATSFDGCRIHNAPSQNLAPTDLNTWTSDGSGSGGTFTRSSVLVDSNPRAPVWELGIGAGPLTSHYFGFSIDAAQYGSYHNKWMLFSLHVKAPYVFGSSDGVVDVRCNGTSTSQSNWNSGNGWVKIVTAFKMPTTGTMSFGVRTRTQSGTGASTVQVALPVLCLAGADFATLIGAIGKQTAFDGTAFPSAGTWNRGDIVWNTTPSAAGDPGWMCVTAGTPGTWKAMANLDA